MLFVKESQAHLVLVSTLKTKTRKKSWKNKRFKKGEKINTWNNLVIFRLLVMSWNKKILVVSNDIKNKVILCHVFFHPFLSFEYLGMYCNEGLKRWTIVFFPSSNEQRLQTDYGFSLQCRGTDVFFPLPPEVKNATDIFFGRNVCSRVALTTHSTNLVSMHIAGS